MGPENVSVRGEGLNLYWHLKTAMQRCETDKECSAKALRQQQAWLMGVC